MIWVKYDNHDNETTEVQGAGAKGWLILRMKANVFLISRFNLLINLFIIDDKAYKFFAALHTPWPKDHTPWPNKNASILFGIIFQKVIN